jgi:methylthioribose-1-phosphate isomerase
MILKSVFWKEGKIIIIDQTKLPGKLEYRTLDSIDDVIEAIVNMRVRGAPLLGVVGALSMALTAYKHRDRGGEEIIKALESARNKVVKSRPTAVNLEWGVNRVLKRARETSGDYKAIVKEAITVMNEDIMVNARMARVGSELIEDGDRILTHCNTGSLATVSIGTALGVILEAIKQGKNIEVYITETRPVLQGARLTAFELILAGIKPILIVDSAVAFTIKKKGINKIFVGADRILRDGTTYNKIGTLQIALAAREYGAEFYVVAPTSTFDLVRGREDIEIEIRGKDEITRIKGIRIAPDDVETYNMAFDETPPELIKGFITEKGIIRPPFSENINRVVKEN